jgi:hypothetical protein
MFLSVLEQRADGPLLTPESLVDLFVYERNGERWSSTSTGAYWTPF